MAFLIAYFFSLLQSVSLLHAVLHMRLAAENTYILSRFVFRSSAPHSLGCLGALAQRASAL